MHGRYSSFDDFYGALQVVIVLHWQDNGGFTADRPCDLSIPIINALFVLVFALCISVDTMTSCGH
jgi:hypothetical protein